MAVHQCDVYTSKGAAGSDWTKLELPESGATPAFMTGCVWHRANQNDGALEVSTCRRAFGAGGGCALSGTYRTRDGVRWECGQHAGKDFEYVPCDRIETPKTEASGG